MAQTQAKWLWLVAFCFCQMKRKIGWARGRRHSPGHSPEKPPCIAQSAKEISQMEEFNIPRTPSAYDYPLLIGHLLSTLEVRQLEQHIVYAEHCRLEYRAFRDRIHRLANALVELGVTPGDTVAVTTRRGVIQLATRREPNMPEGLVFIPFCFAEAPANMLTNPALDPFGKIPELKFSAARLEKL